jgi:hypothetical protein
MHVLSVMDKVELEQGFGFLQLLIILSMLSTLWFLPAKYPTGLTSQSYFGGLISALNEEG